MGPKRKRQNAALMPSLNATRFNRFSNDIVCYICNYLHRSEKSILAAVCKSFLLGSIVSLLRREYVTYKAFLRYKHEHHRDQIQKLQLTSKECNNVLKFRPKALRYLRIKVEENEDTNSAKNIYAFLQQEQCIYQTPPYQLPPSVQKLVVNAPYRFAISELHSLIHLRIEDRIMLDAPFYAFLKTLPKSIQFLGLSLISYSYSDNGPRDDDCDIAFAQIIDSLSNVRFLDLQLHNVSTKFASQSLPIFLSHFINLQTLSLSNLYLGQGTTTISMSTTVTHLKLHGARFVHFFECPNHILSLRTSSLEEMKLPLNLRCLDVKYIDHDAILKQYMLGERLTSLRLSSNFDARIYPNVLPDGLETLFFTDDCTEGMFNQPLEHGVLPPRLQTLVFSAAFNQPLFPNILPSSLTSLHFGIAFDYTFPVGVLLTNLVILTLPMFTQPTVLPSSLTQLNTRFYPFKTFRGSKIPKKCHIYDYRCHDEGYCDFCDIMKKSANMFDSCLCRCAPCSQDI